MAPKTSTPKAPPSTPVRKAKTAKVKTSPAPSTTAAKAKSGSVKPTAAKAKSKKNTPKDERFGLVPSREAWDGFFSSNSKHSAGNMQSSPTCSAPASVQDTEVLTQPTINAHVMDAATATTPSAIVIADHDDPIQEATFAAPSSHTTDTALAGLDVAAATPAPAVPEVDDNVAEADAGEAPVLDATPTHAAPAQGMEESHAVDATTTPIVQQNDTALDDVGEAPVQDAPPTHAPPAQGMEESPVVNVTTTPIVQDINDTALDDVGESSEVPVQDVKPATATPTPTPNVQQVEHPADPHVDVARDVPGDSLPDSNAITTPTLAPATTNLESAGSGSAAGRDSEVGRQAHPCQDTSDVTAAVISETAGHASAVDADQRLMIHEAFMHRRASRLSKVSELMQWPRKVVGCWKQQDAAEPSNHPDRLQRLRGALQDFRMSTSFSGIDTPAVALDMLSATVAEGLMLSPETRPVFHNVFAVEWSSKCQDHLLASPNGPQCLFGDMNDFWNDPIASKIDTLLSSGDDFTEIMIQVLSQADVREIIRPDGFCLKCDGMCEAL